MADIFLVLIFDQSAMLSMMRTSGPGWWLAIWAWLGTARDQGSGRAGQGRAPG